MSLVADNRVTTEKLQGLRERIEDRLYAILHGEEESITRDVAVYSTLGGGHRWRGLLALTLCMDLNPDRFDECMSVACAVEMAHAASLILDDLPSMDDASIRRGKPCPHVEFPRWSVDMAPVFLVNLAYKILLSDRGLDPEERVLCNLTTATAADEMFTGQESDQLACDEDKLQTILDRAQKKSGALYAATAKSAGIALRVDDEWLDTFYRCGLNLGLAYQIFDDVADAGETGTRESLGKDIGMDEGKSTFLSVLGRDAAIDLGCRYRKMSEESVSRFLPANSLTRYLISQASV